MTVLTGSHSHGQGHETTFAQVVADKLGIDASQVDIVHGDTAKMPFGMGTYGSRSLAVGGSAIVKALDKIIEKGRKIASHLLEASEGDIEFENGAYKVKGTDKQKAFGEIALTAYVPHKYPIETLEPGLEETAFYDPKNFTYPAGTYICEVEIDPGHRHDGDRVLHGGGRLRQRGQSDDRRGPGAWRPRARHRPGAARKHRL